MDARRLQATEAAAVSAHHAAVAASDQAGQAAGMDGERKGREVKGWSFRRSPAPPMTWLARRRRRVQWGS